MLVTGSRAQVATRDADALVRALGPVLGVPVASAPIIDAPQVSEVHALGVGSAALVRAVSVLLARGELHVVVGTRGLFGEGWDCPAVNTLIDLTAVATASATQQLRGRTLRLDPAWPEKVAHNWTVTALLPPSFALEAAPDAARLRRKHEQLWGLDVDDPGRVVRGLSGALSGAEQIALRAVLHREGSVDALHDLLELPPREQTRAAWRIGDEYTDAEGVSALVSRGRSAPVFRTTAPASRALGVALAGVVGAAVVLGGSAWGIVEPPVAAGLDVVILVVAAWLGVPLGRAWRHARALRAGGAEAYRRVGSVVWRSLQRAGRVADTPSSVIASLADGTVAVSLSDAALPDQRIFAQAMAEVFGPVRTPRFLLETGRGGRSWIVRTVLRRHRAEQFVAVPSMIGRRQADAAGFAAAWDREVGACTLHPMDHPDRLALLARARRGTGGAPAGGSTTGVGALSGAVAGRGTAPAVVVREEWR
jgi:hypothetical protein